MMPMTFKHLRFPLASLALLLGGCVTTTVEQFVTEAPVIASDEAIVMLTNRQDAVVETEDEYINCLYDRLSSLRKRMTIISEQQFRDALFPWFEARLSPNRVDAVGAILEQDFIKAKADQLGIRYLIWVHGESLATNKQGSLSCTLSAAGGGCFGMLSWDNNSNYEAAIWDLKEERSLGIISSESTGTSMMPAVIVPIPIIARTKGASCRSLGDQLRSVLSGDV